MDGPRIWPADWRGVIVSAEWLAQPGSRSIEAAPTEVASRLGSQRAVDLIVAAVALFAVLPLMVIICLLISASDGGSAFFSQVRIGRMGRPFRCWKFRTMAVDAEAVLAAHLASDPEARADWEACHKLRRDPRVTPIGRFLRASSLDELPQFLNVFRGEMSVVGPRPIVPAEIARYHAYFGDYCRCRSRDYRPVAGERPQRRDLRTARGARHAICPVTRRVAGHQDHGGDRAGRPVQAWILLKSGRGAGPVDRR